MSSEWMDRAECRNHDPEEWFPVGDGETRRQQSAYALYVCRNLCEVRVQCSKRARAMQRPRPIGIWAGVDMGDSASHAVNPAALTELDAVAEEVPA